MHFIYDVVSLLLASDSSVMIVGWKTGQIGLGTEEKNDVYNCPTSAIAFVMRALTKKLW